MIDRRILALLFIALLVGDCLGSHTNRKFVRKSQKMTASANNFRGQGNKHLAITQDKKVLAKKTNGASHKSKKVTEPAQQECEAEKTHKKEESCDTPVVAPCRTVFNNTWETIGECTRTWQTVTKFEVCVDTIKTKIATVDSVTNQKVNWQTLTEVKAAKKVIRRVRKHINVLKPVRICYKTLVPLHVNYQAVANQEVQVQTLAQRSAEVGELVKKNGKQRFIEEQEVCARTLVSKKECIKKVKKVNEAVSQIINTESACLGYKDGASIHGTKTKEQECTPAPTYHTEEKECN